MMSDIEILTDLLASGKTLDNISREQSPDQWLMALNRHFEYEDLVEQSFIAGFCAHTAGYAFAAGYQNAVYHLFQPQERLISSFSMTEKGSTKAEHIQTTFDAQTNTLTGSKGFVAHAARVQRLYVLAQVAGKESKGQEKQEQQATNTPFNIISLQPDQLGVEIKTLPELPFMPEVTHGRVYFDHVKVGPEQILGGDVYTDYIHPFRTFEDLYVLCALSGYLYSVCCLENGIVDLQVKISALYAQLHRVGTLDLRQLATHLELDSVIDHFYRLVEDIENQWQHGDSQEYRNWIRDKVLLQFAKEARNKRTEKARLNLKQKPFN